MNDFGLQAPLCMNSNNNYTLFGGFMVILTMDDHKNGIWGSPRRLARSSKLLEVVENADNGRI